jgi:hypothetical protein
MNDLIKTLSAELIRDRLRNSIILLAKYDSYFRSDMSKLQPEPLYEYLLELIVELQNLPMMFEKMGVSNLFGGEGVLNDNDVPVIALKYPDNNIKYFQKAVGGNHNELKNSIQNYVEDSANKLASIVPTLEPTS